MFDNTFSMESLHDISQVVTPMPDLNNTVFDKFYSGYDTIIDESKSDIVEETRKSGKANDKMINRTEFIQNTIKKDLKVKELLLKDKLLNEFSSNLLNDIKSIFNDTLSVESYSTELTTGRIPGMEEKLIIYVYLSKKVSLDEMMGLWKRISVKSVTIVSQITRNQKEFDDMLEKTTVTLKRC
jgi:hypothetical protein